MAKIPCGSVIHLLGAADDPGSAGCLVQFPDDPQKLFWLTAGHVLVGRNAKQFDPVEAKDLPGHTVGVLFSWTSLGGPTTTDAALVQVDPELVLPDIGTLGVPRGTNLDPKVGASLTIFAMGRERSGKIRQIGVEKLIQMVGPDFEQPVTYVNQILCDAFSVDGCSGAIALDENKNAVGMVVAGDGSTFTLVTPIDAVLSHPDWGDGPPLEIKDAIPGTAEAPSKEPIPGPGPGPNRPTGTPTNNLVFAPDVIRFRPMLDFIAAHEGTAGRPGHGYNTSLGFGIFIGGEKDLVAMTLDQIDVLQTQMLNNPANHFNSSALGRYQIVRTTLRGLKSRLKLPGSRLFSPDLQDQLGVALIKGRGRDVEGLRNEWASLKNVSGNEILNAFDQVGT